MSLSEILWEALNQYTSDTTALISTVKDFIDNCVKWISTNKTTSSKLTNIKEQYSKICDSKFSLKAKGKKAKQKELEDLLSQTLVSLKELEVFLEAVEKLAVTSVHVFEQNRVLVLSDGADLEQIRGTINAAHNICPVLLTFKQDKEAFFSPRLQNIDVMKYQLDQYTLKVEEICGSFKESLPRTDLKIWLDLPENIQEHCITDMLCHINMLQEIRMDEHFRMVILFQDRHSLFMKQFSHRVKQMLQFLSEVEDCAVELDKMKKGAMISRVVSSSVGAIGGVLSIVGVALTPVTLGTSLVLMLTAVGMGVTSGVNSLVTTATEIGVNRTQNEKANQAFANFMDNVTAVQDCLDEVPFIQTHDKDNPLIDGCRVAGKAVAVTKRIYSLVDKASALTAFHTQTMAAKAGKVGAMKGTVLSNMSRAASDIPDVGQVAVKGSLALSRSGLIALNALFLGMDVFFIVKDSISLSKGSETVVSQFLRAKAALWSSEIDSWKKIYECLEKGCLDSEEKRDLLKKPFYEVILLFC